MAYEGDVQKFAPPEVDEVGQIILKARELLSDPGKWHQGGYKRGGAFCVLGALGWRKKYVFRKGSKAPCGSNTILARLVNALPAYAERSPEPQNWNIARFNDSPNTTHADILALLDRAASPPSGKGEQP